MATSMDPGPTKVWHCTECGTRNVTRRRDLFSDQCRHCTSYNDIDWSEATDMTLTEAAAVASELDAD